MADTDAILQELRDRHSYARAEWSEPFEESTKDLKFVAGDPWAEKDRLQREKAGRPCLALDELSQYHNQVINDLRANPRAMKFTPTGNGANDDGAEFYANKAREIEYRSSAQVAYITAAESMIQQGIGWARLKTGYESERSFNQDLTIDPVVNPLSVLADPDAIWPDSRDIRYLFYVETRLKREFANEFPQAEVKDFTLDHQRMAQGWFHGDKIQIAEYWTKELTRKTLYLVGVPGEAEPRGLFKDELPKGGMPGGWRVLRERESETVQVRQYLTNGVEILKETKWLGRDIPFVSAFGKVLYVDEGGGPKRKILSMTRLARDPYMLYCYYRTCEAELVGMTPKFPYFVYEGQLSPEELVKLQKSLHEPVAVIQVKPTVEGAPANTVLTFPSRQPYEPPIMGLEVGAEAARRAIQSSMGISPLPTNAQRQNDKSGRALQELRASSQRGSFHYGAHYDGLITQIAKQVENNLDKVLDTVRDVYVRMADDTSKKVRINDPNDPQSIFTRGDYQVTISTGPDNDSQREAADQFVDIMVGNLQTVAAVSGPRAAAGLLAKSVKMKQLGPVGDEIVELLEPPSPKGKDGKPLPPEVAQLMQENQQLQQQLQQAVQAIQGKQAELQAEGQLEQFKASETAKLKMAEIEFQREKMHFEGEVKLDVAALGAQGDRLSLLLESQRRVADIAHGREQMERDAVEGVKDRLHDVNLAQMGHRQALEAGQMGIEGQMMTQEQAASLQPVDAE